MAKQSKKPAAAKLAAMYAIMSQSEIAGAYNVTVRTVARWLAEDQITKPTQKEAAANE